MTKLERRLLYKIILVNLPAGFVLLLFVIIAHLLKPSSAEQYLPLLVIAPGLSISLTLVLTLREFKKLYHILGELEENIVRLGSENFIPSPPSVPLPEWPNSAIIALKNLVTKFSKTEGELQQKKEWLELIVTALPDGIIIIDASGRIVLSNPPITQITGIKQLEGKFYWEVLRKAELMNILQEVRPGKPPLTTETRFDEQTFFVTAVAGETTNHRILIFNDYTSIIRAERMKQDFVLNVSHELRTPLSAIKGYVETLEETIEPKNRGYLEIIKRHTDRMMNLIQDLLQLARLEEEKFPLQKESIELATLVNNILPIFVRQARKKGITIETAIPDTIKPIEADRLLLEQALINLLDNAVKYTENGLIAITAEEMDNSVAISVRDTGIGIDKEHIDRIFERFYVVNRSRSRQTGGTGLGLAIVKHIIELHKGKIQVKSTPGIGSTFTIILPGKL